jgi:hypothetical protein
MTEARRQMTEARGQIREFGSRKLMGAEGRLVNWGVGMRKSEINVDRGQRTEIR